MKIEQREDTAVDIAKQKTRDYARNLWKLISKHTDIQRFAESPPEVAQPAKADFTNKGLLRLLFLTPYLLLIVFITSFFWDFPGWSFTLWGRAIELQGLLKILSVSGFIGFLTNWLAITMLFRPAAKRPILGHGLIPAQKDRIAYRLAEAVSKDLINPEIIKRKVSESKIISRYREQATIFLKDIIDDPAFRSELKQLVISYFEEMVADPKVRTAIASQITEQVEAAVESKSIENFALKVYKFVRGNEAQRLIEESLHTLPETIEGGLDKLDDVLDDIPYKIDKHSDVIENVVTTLLYRLINQLDVHTLVEENIREFEEKRLEQMIKGATNEQLRYIQYLGAVLGTIGGFVIWAPVTSVIVLGTLLTSILVIDHLLYTLQNK